MILSRRPMLDVGVVLGRLRAEAEDPRARPSVRVAARRALNALAVADGGAKPAEAARSALLALAEPALCSTGCAPGTALTTTCQSD